MYIIHSTTLRVQLKQQRLLSNILYINVKYPNGEFNKNYMIFFKLWID